jgi:hypothetical protein
MNMANLASIFGCASAGADFFLLPDFRKILGSQWFNRLLKDGPDRAVQA